MGRTQADPMWQSGPVGTGDYEVQPGDCLDSIACDSGFFWKTLWELPENADLKRSRKDPNILFPGDRIFIPELRTKDVDGAVDKRHRFVLRGEPVKLRLRFYDDGEPRADERYVLKIDGDVRFGTLDGDGALLEWIPAHASRSEITIGEDTEPIVLKLGEMDPVTEVSGVQGRLRNLAFEPGPVDNIMGPKTSRAISRFQDHYNLEVTGKADRATQNKLVEIHGS